MVEKMDDKNVRRIMLYVAYDGTEYHGWQLQPECVTIEGKLNEALSELLREDIKVIGASRTDAGVHALGNVAVFDTTSKIPGDKFPYALNERLPNDIRVVDGKEVDITFHPRKCDTKKTYEYHILNTKFEIPTKTRYTYHVYHQLDLEAMKTAAKLFEGEHDFTSFCSINSQSESKVRTIYSVDVRKDGDEVVISVTGNGFLYNMVRIIAGTLVEVGKGKNAPSEISNMILAKDRSKAGPTAPAMGLLLAKYEFL